jgi:SNF2 family DNA or RNA helicase
MTAEMYRIRPLWDNFSYFSHQLEGIQWMLDKEKKGTIVSERTGNGTRTIYGGLQCDDMGLGKTIQITSVMVNNPQQATLLLAPLAMIETWSSVCRRAGMAVYEADSKGSISPWKNVNQDGDSFPKRFCKMRPAIYITNYEKLYTNFSIFKGHWDRIVLDEAHKIRNGDGEIARSARKLEAPLRWAVTGTPLVNSLKDVVSIMAFLGIP